ncbi:OmpP1/FadL family transporter [Noviherbaspirillum massiliense]|uniref:OmpP1/FadL family transporter n=1 Tax=Noviherbaspirillum massiliense TaxID=1465823 RepID=UPI0002EFE1BD|nr:outer membrane protein transport protein [Noviherbaspirillum massiliense]
MTRPRHTRTASTLPLLGMLLVSGQVLAGGFALNEMSAGSLGNAHAGGAALAEDASTIFYNPAGLMRMQGRQFAASASGIRPSAEFDNRGSRTTSGPLTGGNGGDAGGWAFVPSLYYAMDINRDMRFGIGVQTPFGLKTSYDRDWVGRYQALKSDLKTVNINPVLAYRVNDLVSVGGGVSAQYIDVELSRAIDFGSVCVGVAGAGTCGAIGFLPQTRDGRVTVSGNDWGFGYNLGAMFTPRSDMRFGVTYRSKISHTLRGDADFDKPAGLPGAIAASPTFTDTDARASLDLPESVNLSGYVDLDPKWSVMADLQWLHWSRFKELRVRFANGAPDSVTPEEWRNTWRVSLGANYRYNDMWKLRAGVAYDQSPVRNDLRTPRVPDANRIWLAFGAQYKLSRQSAIDVGYAHLFVNNASLNKSEPPVGGTLIGDYDSDVNILSVQYSQSF